MHQETPAPLRKQYPPDYPHKPKAAAQRIGKSISWISKRRMYDADLIARGEPPQGPVWAVDRHGAIFYLERDLVDWIRRAIVRVVDATPQVRRESPHKHRRRPLRGRKGADNQSLPPDAA